METSFRESRPILPKKLFLVLTAVLLSTLVFMACMVLIFHSDMPAWSLPVTAILFMVIILFCSLTKYLFTNIFYIIKRYKPSVKETRYLTFSHRITYL